jgi:hypothetical protein
LKAEPRTKIEREADADPAITELAGALSEHCGLGLPDVDVEVHRSRP